MIIDSFKYIIWVQVEIKIKTHIFNNFLMFSILIDSYSVNEIL